MKAAAVKTVVAAVALLAGGFLRGEETAQIEIDQAETAGICGFRPLWDVPVPLAENGAVGMVRSPFGYGDALDAYWLPERRHGGRDPGGLAFDAVHRSLLVRFPTCAEVIGRRIAQGDSVLRIELILPFRDTELWPEYYLEPSGLSFIGHAWLRPPRWHAVGWILRRPWESDPRRGPTYNANINGLSYWTKFGAGDTAADRFPEEFGPAEVSREVPEGRMDLSAVLRDPQFGRTLPDRLAVLSDQGILIRKWETYDASYWSGGYEFATGTGHRAILIHSPRLVVTMSGEAGPGPENRPRGAPAAFPALVARLEREGPIGHPTAVLPTEAQLREFAGRLGFVRPSSMPAWQWKRVEELNALGGGFVFPSDVAGYDSWIDGMLGIPPRRWAGFDSPEMLALYLRYESAWPEPVREHWKLYWSSWLQPDRPYDQLVQGYIGQDQAAAYYRRTHDWRGNFSVYRTYCRQMGPMDFNHWAIAGALIGGNLIGSRYAVEDGRYGLAVFPLHTWSWADGSTQESIDHYYFAITLASQKVFADYGPTAYDRLIGKAILTKSVEELASSFHPNLRRFIATSTRTGPAYLFGEQDGLQHILHVLCPGGAITDLGEKEVAGIQVIGHDLAPGQVAQLSLAGPWAPDWVSAVAERKSLPSLFFAHGWGDWRETYLGADYGLASRETSFTSNVPVMAQWRRTNEKVQSLREVGTLLIRYGINRTDLLDTVHHGGGPLNPNGIVGDQGSHLFLLQARNKLIALASPIAGLDPGQGRPVPPQVRSLQLTAGLYNFALRPGWEIYVGGRRIESLPVRARILEPITIHDGVTYLGILPLPATDLGREREVLLSAGGPPTSLQGGGSASEALRIDLFNLDRPASASPLTPSAVPTTGTWAGMAVEISDATEYPDFASFQRHFSRAAVRIEPSVPGLRGTIGVTFASGGDRLEIGLTTSRSGEPRTAVAYRRVNGRSPYPPSGIVRDGPVTTQGVTGRLEKNGATFLGKPGVMAYLASEPITGTITAFNVPPGMGLNPVELRSPGGEAMEADGPIGIVGLALRPKEARVWIDQGYSPEQLLDPARARRIVVVMRTRPSVELNGIDLPPGRVIPLTWKGRPAWAVPLD